MTETPQLQRKMTLLAAVLLMIGLFTGFYLAAAMTGKVPAEPKMVVAAHLNALLGSFWMFGVAFSLPFTRYGEKGMTRLIWATALPNYANWLVTCVKAWWKVSGVDATGEGRNDTIFGLLTALVVLPSLVAAGAWIYGLTGPGKNKAGVPEGARDPSGKP